MGVTLALLAMLSFASNIIVTRYAVQRMPVEGGFFIVLAVNSLFPLTLFLASLPLRQAPFAWHWEGALYFALAGVMDKFHYLKIGLGVVLTFVGVKMILAHTAWKIDTLVSLGVIVLILTTSVVMSLLRPKKVVLPVISPQPAGER